MRAAVTGARFRIGATILIVLIIWSLVGPHLAPPASANEMLTVNAPPSASHWFGTDQIGRDVYSETVSGLRKSLVIGLVAGPLSTLIAAALGAAAGYLGGRTDAVISWFTNLMLVVPTFFLMLLLSPVFTRLSWLALIPFIAVFGWMIMAQVVRGQTRTLRSLDFVKAARYMGVGTPTIIRRHILPHLAALLIIDAAIGVGWAVMMETSLSYFGFGVRFPQTSLGTLMDAGKDSFALSPWLFVFPAVVLVIMLLAVSLIGDALRDALDPMAAGRRYRV